MTTALVFGTGAIGGFYGSLLARQGLQVSVVCRSDYPHIKQHGFQINSHELGQWPFQPEQTFNSTPAVKTPVDYLLVCTKVLDTLDRVKLIKPAVSKATTIVLIQNGIAIEDEIIAAFPDNEVVSGLAFICSNRISHGEIEHLAYGRLTLGNAPRGYSEKTQQLVTLFQNAGIDCQLSESITTARWQKCIWNAPFNPLSVLSGGLSTQTILQTQEPLVRAIMQEVFTIAKALGHRLPNDIIDTNINNTHQMPPYKTSMLLDYQAGRPMEINAILGNTIKAASHTNTECPYLKTLFSLLQLKELTEPVKSSDTP
ncbi:MAG TPA: 2-dehydropantoate 2-reductase [Methylococcaceae bacterium]|jgi:2-dehydropantoate 2-reductase|nr:2-dehydropantoate 2-reductase [Methylococcaceae bacterium]HIA45649.1 2-dehydropantoate 2-reductase [Methylococcaceae bacterium]HIN68647.1 2-dehydropantoate 2-reductase [Methylococcales bacterium]HIO12761.1 2-dehydropantoate 2-reductase [Methylococcales bacterium]